jgi:hypothetical protein
VQTPTIIVANIAEYTFPTATSASDAANPKPEATTSKRALLILSYNIPISGEAITAQRGVRLPMIPAKTGLSFNDCSR